MILPRVLTAGGYLGTFDASASDAERTVLIGRVPSDGEAIRLLALTFAVSVEISGSTTDFWIVDVGTTENGLFSTLGSVSLSGGIQTGGLTVPLPRTAIARAGATLAIRGRKSGNPTADLANASFAVDYAVNPGR